MKNFTQNCEINWIVEKIHIVDKNLGSYSRIGTGCILNWSAISTLHKTGEKIDLRGIVIYVFLIPEKAPVDVLAVMT